MGERGREERNEEERERKRERGGGERGKKREREREREFYPLTSHTLICRYPTCVDEKLLENILFAHVTNG